MKPPNLILTLTILCSIATSLAQDNVFLDRGYWKANPSIEKIENDIASGNDATAMTSALFDAVCYALLEKTDNATIKHLLTIEGNDVNKRTHDGRTYLMWAGYANNLEMVKYLVEKGAKADVEGSHGYNAINFAARGGVLDTALYDFLLANGADINDTTNSGANALLLIAPATTGYGMRANSANNYAMIDYLVGKGIDINSTDTDGNGLFHYAARGGDVELLKKLIAKGLPFDALNKKGGNAILMASQGIDNSKNGLATIKYLEGLGLEPNITDSEGRNPLHAIAYDSGDLSIYKYLIEKGVDVNQQDKDGDSPFMNAANSNEPEVVKFLRDYVKDINATDENGRSALAMAVNRNKPEVVEFLLEKGADIKVIDKKGNSLAYYLLNNYNSKKPEKFEAKLKILKDKDLSMNIPQQNGNTLLHLAAEANNLDLLKRLEDFKIDINQKNKEGNTALHLAAMSSENKDILKYLVAQGADKSLKTDFEETVYDLASENELLKGQMAGLEFLK